MQRQSLTLRVPGTAKATSLNVEKITDDSIAAALSKRKVKN